MDRREFIGVTAGAFLLPALEPSLTASNPEENSGKVRDVVLEVLVGQHGGHKVYVVIVDSFWPPEPGAKPKNFQAKPWVNRAWHVYNEEAFLKSFEFNPEYNREPVQKELPGRVIAFIEQVKGDFPNRWSQFHMFETRFA